MSHHLLRDRSAMDRADPGDDSLENEDGAPGIEATSASYRRSDTVFSQGAAADSVFYIKDGAVKLSVLSRGGKEGIVAILESGDFFGESALAGCPLRLESAMAMTTTTVLIIPKAQMTRALNTDPVFSHRFITHMLARNIRLEGDLVDQLLSSCEKRLARALLLLAHYGKPGKARRVLPSISQATLAELVGTTRSRVNFFMNRFKHRGLIEDVGGRLKINESLVTVTLQDETVDPPQWKAS